MSNLPNVETEQRSSDSDLDIAAIKERIMAAGIDAKSAFALVDADDAEIRFAVVDDSLPDGGYIKSFPLLPGQTYLVVPLTKKLAGRGLVFPND